ncbi:hypothetical protein ACJX0J_023227, partial [Zea mays]
MHFFIGKVTLQDFIEKGFKEEEKEGFKKKKGIEPLSVLALPLATCFTQQSATVLPFFTINQIIFVQYQSPNNHILFRETGRKRFPGFPYSKTGHEIFTILILVTTQDYTYLIGVRIKSLHRSKHYACNNLSQHIKKLIKPTIHFSFTFADFSKIARLFSPVAPILLYNFVVVHFVIATCQG